LIIIVSYFLDSWKSICQLFCPTCFSGLLIQFLTSHAIFIHRAYAKWVDRIISCKFSSFSIHDVTFRNMLPKFQALWTNTCNNCYEANLTKVGFGNYGHCSVIINSVSHSHWALTRTWLITFWSFCLYTAMVFLKMWTFILTWFWCWGPPLKVESLQGLAFSTTKPCTSFKCLVNNHLAQYATM